MKKHVVGNAAAIDTRGLIEQVESRVPTDGEVVQNIPLTSIIEGENVRGDYRGVEDLQASIAHSGLLSPVVVRREGEGFKLVFGFRRYRAVCRLAAEDPQRWGKIPAIVREGDAYDGDGVRETQLVENLQREGLTGRELREALTYLRERGLSVKDIAHRLGKGESLVKQWLTTLNSLEANPEVQELLTGAAGCTSGAPGGERLTMTDLAEVRPLPAKLQVQALREKLEGHLPNREALRQRVAELREQADEKGKSGTRDAPGGSDPRVAKQTSRLWRETPEGVLHIRAHVLDPRKLRPEQWQAVIRDLRGLVSRAEAMAKAKKENRGGRS